MRQNPSFPFEDIEISLSPAPPAVKLESQLAFVRVGLWEVRRRFLAGQVGELDSLLANLDEDVERLSQSLQTQETPAEECEVVI